MQAPCPVQDSGAILARSTQLQLQNRISSRRLKFSSGCRRAIDSFDSQHLEPWSNFAATMFSSTYLSTTVGTILALDIAEINKGGQGEK